MDGRIRIQDGCCETLTFYAIESHSFGFSVNHSDQFVIVCCCRGRFEAVCVVWVDWVSLDRLDAEEELCQVVKDAAGVRVVIFTGSPVLEVIVALVVEHLVRRQVHGRVQELQRGRKGLSKCQKVFVYMFVICHLMER